MPRKYKIVVTVAVITESGEVLYTGADTGEVVQDVPETEGETNDYMAGEGPALVDLAKCKITEWFGS